MIRMVWRTLRAMRSDRSGASAIEYVLFVAVLGVLVILSAEFLGREAARVQQEISTTLKNAKPK